MQAGAAEGETPAGRLSGVLAEILGHIYLAAPHCSASHLRERIASKVPATVASLTAAGSDLAPEHAEVVQQLLDVPEAGRYSVYTLLEELDYYPQRGDVESIVRQIRLHCTLPTKATEIVHTICEWSVTRYLPFHTRKMLATSLLSKYMQLLAADRMQTDSDSDAWGGLVREHLQPKLHQFLDAFDCQPSSPGTCSLWHLWS